MKASLTAGRKIATTAALGVLILGLAAPRALAAPNDGAGGTSAEHRRDDNAHARNSSDNDSGKATASASSTSSASSSADHQDGNASTTGDVNSPQPASNADFTGHGANQHGVYDSTRDGSPSANGNGGGTAVGKPCAGCVGKADNKNPAGQFPDGSDSNKGYECDANNGIGKTNPAHTGCVTVQSSSSPPVPSPPPGGAEVLGVSFTAPASVAAAAAEAPAAVAPAALAATGAGTTLAALTTIGAALLLLGLLLVSRRWGGRASQPPAA